jgi:hypothetical protein
MIERQIITNIDELNGNANDLANQTSGMIAEYNSGHPHEMLSKPPEIVVKQFEKGLSVMMITPINETREEVVFHGSLYPSFEDGEEKILGCQVVECGSWIVNPKYRGHGLGTEGVGKLMDLGREIWSPVLFLATHKRMAALKVSRNLNLVDVQYHDFPYLSYLTCTCVNCSEAHGFTACGFRRKTQEMEIIGEDGKIGCTLVVSDLNLANNFEQRCRELHSKMGVDYVEPGVISIDTMNRARSFFDGLKLGLVNMG